LMVVVFDNVHRHTKNDSAGEYCKSAGNSTAIHAVQDAPA